MPFNENMNDIYPGIRKCRYYNDAQSACSLMIDDFVPVSVTTDGIMTPANDWGYGMGTENSLYRYFEDNLLVKYPEIKGTFFIPLELHRNLDSESGYTLIHKDFDREFKQFFKEISPFFDLAFHGIRHTYHETKSNRNNLIYEFNHLNLSDVPEIKEKIRIFEEIIECKLEGGKFPGYRGNESALMIVEELDFLWWSSFKRFLHFDKSSCQARYFGRNKPVLDIPLTFHGNAFNRILIKQKSWKNWFRYMKRKNYRLKAESFLRFLYENQLVITIQEHFQNQRTDGFRQTVNIYADITSLDFIFGYLRGADIWYTTINELAHYLDSYLNCEVIQQDKDQVKIQYKGRWPSQFLSFTSKSREIVDQKTGSHIRGWYKGGSWVYNNLPEGTYSIV